MRARDRGASRTIVLALLVGCGDAPRAPAVHDVAVVVAPEARARAAYLDDIGFRRAALERSLENPGNGYSRDRLASYARADQGWELLPEWNPRTMPLTDAVLDRMQGGTLELPAEATPIADDARPGDAESWRALGQRVFFELPLRADDSLAAALGDRQRGRALGLYRDRDGRYPGLVVFEDHEGAVRIGITCALCHTSEHDGVTWPGLARRELDYGVARLDHATRTGDTIGPELAGRMARWGPGRADITGDDDEDPVAIPDLWHLLELSALTQAGTLRLAGTAIPDPLERAAADLVVLAIRQETQIIQAGGERTRPPRELAWALASYIAELEPPPREPVARAGRARGAELFDSHCDRCHDGPSLGGTAIDAAKVGTDRALADSRARGTGKLRVAPLVAVSGAAPYFHDGSVSSLYDVLDPARLQAGYVRGVRELGPVPGHAFGTELAAIDRAALLDYLASL